MRRPAIFRVGAIFRVRVWRFQSGPSAVFGHPLLTSGSSAGLVPPSRDPPEPEALNLHPQRTKLQGCGAARPQPYQVLTWSRIITGGELSTVPSTQP